MTTNENFTERMVWQLRWQGFEVKSIAHLLALSETEIMRILAVGREPTAAEGEERP